MRVVSNYSFKFSIWCINKFNYCIMIMICIYVVGMSEYTIICIGIKTRNGQSLNRTWAVLKLEVGGTNRNPMNLNFIKWTSFINSAQVINGVQDFFGVLWSINVSLIFVFPGCNVSSWPPSSSCCKTTRRHLGRCRRETWRSSSDSTPSEPPLWLFVLRSSLFKRWALLKD